MPADGRGAAASTRRKKSATSILYSASSAAKSGAQRPPWGQGGGPTRVPAAAVTTRPGAHAVWEQIARTEAEKAVQTGWVSEVVHRAVRAHSSTQPRPAQQQARGATIPKSGTSQQQRRRPLSAPALKSAKQAPLKLRKTPGIDSESDTSGSSSSSDEGENHRSGGMSDDSDKESARSRGRGGEAGARTAVARPNKHVTIVTRVENRDPDARVRALTRARPRPSQRTQLLMHLPCIMHALGVAVLLKPHSLRPECSFPPGRPIPHFSHAHPPPPPPPRSRVHPRPRGAPPRAEAAAARERGARGGADPERGAGGARPGTRVQQLKVQGAHAASPEPGTGSQHCFARESFVCGAPGGPETAVIGRACCLRPFASATHPLPHRSAPAQPTCRHTPTDHPPTHSHPASLPDQP